MPSLKKTPSRMYCGTVFFSNNDIEVSAIVKQEMIDKCNNMIGEKVTQRSAITYFVYQTERCPRTQRLMWRRRG